MEEFHCVGSSRMTQHVLNLTSQCAHCGKVFMHTDEHAYRRKEGNLLRLYCSYNCYRKKAKEDERKAREKFERSATSDQRREAQLKKRDSRRWGYRCGKNWEYVVFENEEAAKEYAEHAQKKIELYEQAYLTSEAGTDERAAAQRNIARWKRIKKNIKVKEKAECTHTRNGSC